MNDDNKKPMFISAPPENKSGNQKYLKLIISFAVGLIIGIFITALVVGSGDETPEVVDTDTEGEVGGVVVFDEDEEETLPENLQEIATASSVQVKDQEAGDRAFVSRVEMGAPGWVAIHEEVNGELGSILGAARFDEGVHQGEIVLLRPTVAGQTYHAALWADNGDRLFDHAEDVMLTTAAGEPVALSFETF